ncbi:MAG: glycosyltransferase family 87 protein, partial [Nitrospinota bacterium]
MDPRLRFLFLLVVLMLLGRHAVLVLRTAVLSDAVDLGTYYVHARMLWEGANPVNPPELLEYGRRLGLKPLAGVSPPTFSFLFLPFALLPWGAAKVAWTLAGQAALFGAGWIAWREMVARGLPRRESALGVAGFAAVFYPAKQTLTLGQMDLLLGLAAAGMGWAMARGRGVLAGILALALGWMKIQLGAVIVFLLWTGRVRRELGAVALLGLIWLGGAVAVFGGQPVIHYLEFLRDHLGKGLNPDSVNYSLNGLLARALQPRTGAAFAQGVNAILTAAIAVASFWVLWAARKSREGAWLEAGFLLLSVWMLAPLSEEHHLAWLIAPLLVAMTDPALREGRLQAALFLGALLLVGVEHYPHALWKGPGVLPELLRSS